MSLCYNQCIASINLVSFPAFNRWITYLRRWIRRKRKREDQESSLLTRRSTRQPPLQTLTSPLNQRTNQRTSSQRRPLTLFSCLVFNQKWTQYSRSAQQIVSLLVEFSLVTPTWLHQKLKLASPYVAAVQTNLPDPRTVPIKQRNRTSKWSIMKKESSILSCSRSNSSHRSSRLVSYKQTNTAPRNLSWSILAKSTERLAWDGLTGCFSASLSSSSPPSSSCASPLGRCLRDRHCLSRL